MANIHHRFWLRLAFVMLCVYIASNTAAPASEESVGAPASGEEGSSESPPPASGEDGSSEPPPPASGEDGSSEPPEEESFIEETDEPTIHFLELHIPNPLHPVTDFLPDYIVDFDGINIDILGYLKYWF